MSNDPSVRRILPQDAPAAQMSTFTFAPPHFPQRETQKNYVFVDEHNRHKRLKVMRACEGCRRRKIKCDAATTNTWPCSACIRLKLHCVRPNGYDGSETTTYDAFVDSTSQFQQMSLQPQLSQPPPPPKTAQAIFADGFADADAASFQSLAFDAAQSQHNLHYTTMPAAAISLLDQQYASQNAFSTPPLQHASRPDSSPEAYSTDSYQNQDLADLLGGLKVNELGTAPYLRNKASFRREEQPAVEDDDEFGGVLPPIASGPGHKIRIPPELMPDEASALHYFDLYFANVHPYVPVLDKARFYHQWSTARETMSPLILEAMFAIGGRLAEEPAQGQQWLALASRHADAFMDTPRLSTLQALLMILKAREAAPKRGYYYRSWMTVVQCVQMGKDLGLDEHYDDHQAGRPCEVCPAECLLRTRIWQTVFVCEVMVGTPQGRHDLSVDLDSVDFGVPAPMAGGDDGEYLVSRNFGYFARLVRNIGKMTHVYGRIKRKKDWGMDPEFQQVGQDITSFAAELPADLSVSFPPDGSPPMLQSAFVGNLHTYYYLVLILHHRPVLSFLDPNSNESQWKHHMLLCYNAARAICRLQEASLKTFGLLGLQSMQRGFSFHVYAGLSCIVLHLVAIVSPDPEFNSDAREYFTRHMRITEKVMEAWSMPELQKQVDAVREAFSADVRRPFVLKPSFPYGSPHSSSHSSPPRGYRPLGRAGSLDQHMDAQHAAVSHTGLPATPPISAGPGDSRSDSPAVRSLMLMARDSGQGPDLNPGLPVAAAQSSWNPARIFEQWNTSFGAPAQAGQVSPSPGQSINVAASSSAASDMSALHDYAGMDSALPAQQHMAAAAAAAAAAQYSAAAPMASFITPAMWQESVASVYEGGLKRNWEFDGLQPVKRR